MPKDEHLTSSVKITNAITITAGASGTTAINGATLDMSGFSGLAVILKTGPITATAVTSFKIEQSDNSDMSSPSDLAGSNQAIADNDDDEMFIFDGIRPQKRYVRIVVSRATASSTVDATYLQYGADRKPVTQPANVVVVEQFKDPIGGAA